MFITATGLNIWASIMIITAVAVLYTVLVCMMLYTVDKLFIHFTWFVKSYFSPYCDIDGFYGCNQFFTVAAVVLASIQLAMVIARSRVIF